MPNTFKRKTERRVNAAKSEGRVFDAKRPRPENEVESSLPGRVEVDDKRDARRTARDRVRGADHFAKQVKPAELAHKKQS
jgi:hypothetical protein